MKALTAIINEFDLKDLTDEIKRTMRQSAKDAVQLGYMLRRVMDGKLYATQYQDFDTYLREELHMDYTMANRFIGINKKYSTMGESAELAFQYEGYSQGLLIEMLSMTPEQEAQVTPQTTVKQAREIKRRDRAQKKAVEESETDPKETVIDGEFREIPVSADVATSQSDIPEAHNEKWFVEQYLKMMPGSAEKMIEICKKESSQELSKAIQKYISPYGFSRSRDPGYDFDFGSYTKGVSLKIGSESLRMTYKRFAKELVEHIKEMEAVQEVTALPQPALSAYGLPKSQYKEGSLIATEGCGNKYCCFSCARDCEIRGEKRYCVEAPMGNPFSCGTMELMDKVKADYGLEVHPHYGECQFINLELACHSKGTNEPNPCCKKCEIDDCAYRCNRAMSIKVSGDPGIASEKPVQPELPLLKNIEQRKKWLEGYKDWGLWYRDENIDVNYYKFDFADGSRLVVAEYPQRPKYYWRDNEMVDEVYYHLLEKNRYGDKSTFYEHYRHQASSETEIVEFLKNFQKKRKDEDDQYLPF